MLRKHFVEQPFVMATGLAALIHSTWALGTFFSGIQPAAENITGFMGWLHLVGWILPAFLIAFALDVGQISTSGEIRKHGLNMSRGLTFVVFAGATYYLQWLYMVHHMPALEMSGGVQAFASQALWLRDMAVWFIPALLPLSTLLYTFSAKHEGATAALPSMSEQSFITVQKPAPESLAAASVSLLEPLHSEEDTAEVLPTGFQLQCDDCGWTTGLKDTYADAGRSLRTHQSRHCEARHASEKTQEG